jgi:hypothetical protein
MEFFLAGGHKRKSHLTITTMKGYPSMTSYINHSKFIKRVTRSSFGNLVLLTSAIRKYCNNKQRQVAKIYPLKIVSLIIASVSMNAYSAPPSAPSGKSWATVVELSDEFNGAALDTTKWDDYHPNWSGRAPSAFKKGNCYVANGNLNLKSTLRKDPSKVNNKFVDVWVDAAACVSKQRSAKPGYYYEARFKASNLSMTSSFWFRVGDYSEIDVIEHIGAPSVLSREKDLPFQYHANTHYYGKYQGTPPKASEWKMPTRGRDEFHTYGFWWKDSMTLWFYHNGTKVMEIVPRQPLSENLKMVFDTEVFPFATAGVANIGLPTVQSLNDSSKNTMLVDWVRTYKLVDGITPPPPNNATAIPGLIEAESYSSQNGVQVEATTDTGGGRNLGYIENGDYAEFNANVAATGNYEVSFRVASAGSGGYIFVVANGSNVGSVDVANSGGWQNWTTVKTQLRLNAGQQKIRLNFSGANSYLFNLNWIDFKSLR